MADCVQIVTGSSILNYASMIERAISAASTPMPALSQIIAHSLANRYVLYWFLKIEADAVLVLVPMRIDERQVHSLNLRVLNSAGVDMFDYTLFICNPACAAALLKTLNDFARNNALDAVYLQHVSGDSSVLSKLANSKYELNYFDSRLSERSWDWLLKKKSLKQARVAAQRLGRYRVRAVRGEQIADHIEAFARLHVERWQFDGKASPLAHEWRRQTYRCLTENAVLTLVEASGSVIAAHYGLIHGNTLHFHTPAINIRFLAVSPLQVLLYEIASFCSNEGLQCIDYGQGLEAYKSRFANQSRECTDALLPNTLRGTAASLVKDLTTAHPDLKEKLNHLKTRAARAWNRVRHKAGSEFKYYINEKTADLNSTNELWRNQEAKGVNTNIVDNYSEFCSLADRFGVALERKHFDRFRQGEVFCCATQHSLKVGAPFLVGWAWCRTNLKQPLPNKNDPPDLHGPSIIYDIEVKPGAVFFGVCSQIVQQIFGVVGHHAVVQISVNQPHICCEIESLHLKRLPLREVPNRAHLLRESNRSQAAHANDSQ